MIVDEYVLGLLAILSGLAICQFVGSVAALLMARGRVRWDWLAGLAALQVGYVIVYGWYLSWSGFHGSAEGLPFWRFVMLVASVALQFLAARAVLPDVPADGVVVLRDNYEANGQIVWRALLISGVVVLGGIAARHLTGEPMGEAAPWGLAGNLVLLLGLVILSTIQRRRVHAVIVRLQFAILLTATLTLTF